MHTDTPENTVLSASLKHERREHEPVDAVSRTLIAHALDIQKEFGTICAMEYLKSFDLDAATIARALMHAPERRLVARPETAQASTVH